MRKFYQYLIAFLIGYITCSLFFNYYDKIESKLTESLFSPCEAKNDSLFEKYIRSGTMYLISKESWGYSYLHTDWLKLKFCKLPKVSDYGEFALLMHYSLLYARQRNDNELKLLCKSKFDNIILGNANWKFINVDQAPYGLVALNLYNITKEQKYLTFSTCIFNRLDSLYSIDGNIYYGKKTEREQRVDGIGLVCPFLYEYAMSSNNSRAKTIANTILHDYITWCTDYETGYPFKAYRTDNHLKTKIADWGRGISWYTQALHYYDNTTDSVSTDRIKRFDTLLMDNKTNCVSKYYGEEGYPDMSATIPMIFYLQTKNLRKYSKQDVYSLICSYFDKNGIMRYGSNSCFDYKDKPNAKTTNLAIQGMTLYLFSILE